MLHRSFNKKTRGTAVLRAIFEGDVYALHAALTACKNDGLLPPDDAFEKAFLFYAHDPRRDMNILHMLIGSGPTGAQWPQAYRRGLIEAIENNCAPILASLLRNGADPLGDAAQVRRALKNADGETRGAVIRYLEMKWNCSPEDAKRRFEYYAPAPGRTGAPAEVRKP